MHKENNLNELLRLYLQKRKQYLNKVCTEAV